LAQGFPVDWPEDEYRSRREFVAFLMLTSAAFVAGQFWILLIQTWGKPLANRQSRSCLCERAGGWAIKAL
jgi:hypothetical protein